MRESYPIFISRTSADYSREAGKGFFVVGCQFKPKRFVGLCELAYVTIGKMPTKTVDLGELNTINYSSEEEIKDKIGALCDHKRGKWRVVLEKVE